MDSQMSYGADASDAILREATEEYTRSGAAMTSQEYDEILGKLIRRERLARGLTAEAAAEKADLAYKTYLRVESGKPVRYMTWRGIEILFDLTVGAIHAARATYAPPHEVATTLSSTRTNQIKEEPASLPPYGIRTEPDPDHGHQPTLPRVPGARRITNLWDRLEGLELDDLKRLRDMIDGAIFTMQSSVMEADVAVAAVRVADASSAVSMLQSSMRDIASAISRAKANSGGTAELEYLEHERLTIEAELDRAAERLTEARMNYEYLRNLQAEGKRKAQHYLIRGDNAEHGETPER